MSVSFKRLSVYNIDERITTNDISQLLNFNTTPFLVNHSCVQIREDEGEGKYATVICPADAHVEALKLNGVTFFDKTLRIVDADEVTNEPAENTLPKPQQDNEAILFLRLDCRNHPDLNFPPVTEREVCQALKLVHPNDPHKAVKSFQEVGTFGIESVEMEKYLDTKLIIRGHEIPLTAVRKKTKRQSSYDPEGVKIRIYDAYGLSYRHIQNGTFDEYFKSLGVDIIKQCQPEKCREDRDIYNTHRYLVVKSTNKDGVKVDFGTRITVGDHSFKIWYPNIQKFCGLCQRKHGWDCPTKTRFEFLRKLRQGKTTQCKIYSDSLLRNANQLALRTDVACMTGGAIGQICNAIPYDPKKTEEVIINGGTNELKIVDLNEFMYTVTKSGQKLSELAKTTPVTVVLPEIPKKVPESIIKTHYLHNEISKVENVNVVVLSDIEMDDGAYHKHPTKDGTINIIKQIDASKNVIMDKCDDDIYLPAKYRGVQTLFKVGCRGCQRKDYNPFLCDTCHEDAKAVDTTVLVSEIKRLTEEMFPPINDEDDEMNRAYKRDRSNSNGDENGEKISKKSS